MMPDRAKVGVGGGVRRRDAGGDRAAQEVEGRAVKRGCWAFSAYTATAHAAL